MTTRFDMHTAHRTLSKTPATAPAFVRRPNSLVRGLMRLGVPMGPNTLLTVRGRRSGQPRTVPVAVTEADGRRFVIGAYGDVHWVRNLRAAGGGEIVLDGRETKVSAVELDLAEAEWFYRDIVGPYLSRQPRILQVLVRAVFRLVAPDILDDPALAARKRPVFELLERDAT
ncbi:MAG TPA: nitroreductase family deazaflavin-dependent oxidoreductase [Candidatus Limnocylindrales bacterium]|nr:nitroreductase family deazaflavin-dependent oxidoreductase [Candidatus Limnocylindrales bacterium]